MSRETDSSSSGPQGHGGAAYPSGTPPYGAPGGTPTPGADAERQAAEPPSDESDPQATQTTLTTRIRINIPGSRPIPPVVMRTPVNDGEASDGAAASAGAGAASAETGAGASGAAGSE
ncbi:hypothetical protein P8605_44060, partial [Streptomyces sp. T-3]|nr:hypothetical protein [Streptomyces sp. T-3]